MLKARMLPPPASSLLPISAPADGGRQVTHLSLALWQAWDTVFSGALIQQVARGLVPGVTAVLVPTWGQRNWPVILALREAEAG